MVSEVRPQLYTPSIEEGKEKDLFNTISSIAIPAILITACVLSIYYGVSVSASINVPLLVCGSISVISFVLLMIQIGYREEIKESFGRATARVISFLAAPIVRSSLYIGARKHNDEMVEALREARAVIQDRNTQIVSYQAQDSVKLKGIWRCAGENCPTVILFHGNASRADWEVQSTWWRYYCEKGFNILLHEYRGYGMSEGEAATENQELEAYYDAEAAKAFVLSQDVPKNKIIAHGVSLGSVYAAAIGLDIGAVVFNHPFTTFPAVAKHMMKGWLPSVVNGVCQRAFPFKNYQTDLFDNIAKVRAMNAELLVIRGENDGLMKYEFGEELRQARYGQEQQQRLLTFPGGHDQCYDSVERFSAQIDQFFRECGF